MIVYLIISSIILVAITSIVIYLILTNNKINKKINSMESNKQLPIKFNISFEDCDKYIDNVINDIWQNKYFLNYRLRDLVIIPEMDKEIKNLTEDVISSIGDPIMTEILNFYSYEYIIRKITRKAQMLFIEYTKTYKPSTK